jgi:hypothetical protein
LRCPNCEIAAANENVDARIDQQHCAFPVLLGATIKAAGIDDKIPPLDEAFPSHSIGQLGELRCRSRQLMYHAKTTDTSPFLRGAGQGYASVIPEEANRLMGTAKTAPEPCA